MQHSDATQTARSFANTEQSKGSIPFTCSIYLSPEVSTLPGFLFVFSTFSDYPGLTWIIPDYPGLTQIVPPKCNTLCNTLIEEVLEILVDFFVCFQAGRVEQLLIDRF